MVAPYGRTEDHRFFDNSSDASRYEEVVMAREFGQATAKDEADFKHLEKKSALLHAVSEGSSHLRKLQHIINDNEKPIDVAFDIMSLNVLRRERARVRAQIEIVDVAERVKVREGLLDQMRKERPSGRAI